MPIENISTRTCPYPFLILGRLVKSALCLYKLDKHLRRHRRVLECTVMIELKAVIIGNGIELIIRKLTAQNLLRKRKRIILFFIEHIPALFAVILHETVVKANVMPYQNRAVGKLVKIGKNLIHFGFPNQIFVLNPR